MHSDASKEMVSNLMAGVTSKTEANISIQMPSNNLNVFESIVGGG